MTLRGTLVGCGFFAANHLNAWMDIEGVEIVAVCDLDPAKASNYARMFGIPRHYTDADKMLATEKPDFVDIVTTVESHRKLVELAARHNVAAICQKPFATNLEDATAMVAACARANVPLMVHENFRWQRPLMEVARVLLEGRIGKPFFGRISFRHDFDVYRNQPYLAMLDRFAILDVGIHILEVARYYFGEAHRLTCSIQRANPHIRGEDVATLMLEHESGVTSIVDCSFYTHAVPNPFPQTFVEVDGSSGSIRLGPDYRMEVTSGCESATESVESEIRPWMEKPWHVVQDSVFKIQKHWVQCLSKGLQPATSGNDNLRTLRLGLAGYESAETGKSIHFTGSN